MKVKVWIGKDKVYNQPYYRVIGEVDEVPENKNVFLMRWRRKISKQVYKRDIKLQPLPAIKWYWEFQDTLFLITNRNSQGIYVCEVFDDNPKQTFKL